MDTPVNAAYGRGTVPKDEPRAITVLGVRIPGSQVGMITVGVVFLLVMLLAIIVIQLPSGLPYLAAKNADGFLGYLGLYTAYMIGFVAVLGVVATLLAVAGAGLRETIPLFQ